MTNLHHWLCVILLQKKKDTRKNSTPWILTIAKRLEKFKKGANESHGLAGYRWVRADNMSTSTSYIKEAMPLQCLFWFIESFFSFLFLFQVLNHCYSVILVCLSGTIATVLFVFFFLLNIYKNSHIYCYINTINFTIFSQLLRCQFLIN